MINPNLQGANGNLRKGAIGRGRKLNCDQARAIFSAAGNMADIGKQYGVSQYTVFKIKHKIGYLDCVKGLAIKHD